MNLKLSRTQTSWFSCSPTPELTNLWRACSKWHAERFSWHATFTDFTIFNIFFFLLPDRRLCIVKNTCLYTHTSDSVQTVYELPLLPNHSAVKHIYTDRSGAKCWLDIYRWVAGLAATGRIRHIGQNVLQCSFVDRKQQHSCYHILFLFAFLGEAIIRNKWWW